VSTRRREIFAVTVLSAVLVTAGCGTSGATSTTAGSGPAAGGDFVPASGTAKSGALFLTYASASGGYSVSYPGGWRIVKQGTGVRISRFGNTIVATMVKRKAKPYYKGYQRTLRAQLAKNHPRLISAIVQPAAQLRVGDQPVTTAVIAQRRPATQGSPGQTVVTHRYLYWSKGRLLILSCSSPKGTDNSAAYDLIGTSVAWK
jgi:hypothetical protein